MDLFIRPIYKLVLTRLTEKRRFIQVLAGSRQVGKTTLILQLVERLSVPHQYASADEPTLQDRAWIAQQWDLARLKIRDHGKEGLLVLDEVHKVAGWSETVKRLWDEDTKNRVPLKVVLMGSAPLLIQAGLTESLAGRFEIIPISHWSYPEMKEAFGWGWEEYVFFGGYPGAAELIHDEMRWKRYVVDSIVETTLSRDVFLLSRIDKPALLRRLFYLGCAYSGQVLSYQKMLGQLQDAGNTTTLAHYLELLSGCGVLTGLQKFSGGKIRQRGSSPKFQVLNMALMTATVGLAFREAKENRELWGRLVESAVGAHLLCGVGQEAAELFYWREGNEEVDFVVQKGKKLIAIEVKSGRKRELLGGLAVFEERFQPVRRLLIGSGGIPLEEFFQKPMQHWLGF